EAITALGAPRDVSSANQLFALKPGQQFSRLTRDQLASLQGGGSASLPATSAGAGAVVPAANSHQNTLAQLDRQIAHINRPSVAASGAVLTAYNQQIHDLEVQKSYIRQGADAELAKSLASKQGAAETKAASEAARAARQAEQERLKALREDAAYQ